MALLLGLLYLALRLNYFKLVHYLLPLLIWLALTCMIAIEDGIRDVNVAGFGLVLVLAGLLISARAVLVFGVLCLGSTTAAYLAERSGWLETAYMMPSQIDDWGVLSTLLGMTTFLTYYAVTYLEQIAEQAQQDAALLTQRNQELSEMQISLEGRTAELFSLNSQLQNEVVERQQVEQVLHQNQGLVRAILDYMPDMILQLDKDGNFIDYSPARNMAPMVPPEMFIGRNMADILPPEVAIPGIRAIQEAIETNEMQFFEYSLEENGETLIFESRNIPVDKERVLTIVRDVTDERHAEQAALQTQKLESIGLLAGGIAHDFNNLLTGMLGQNSLALAKLSPDAPVRRHLEKSVVSAKRAADLTRQLLAYAGKGQFLIEPIDLNKLVYEGTGLLETVLPKQATLSLDLAEDLPMIEADRGQIQQVMMNLVINASEAIDEPSGQVVVRTYLETITAVSTTTDLILPEAIAPGTYVCLEVNDTGRGLDREAQERIFDPYFSTKGQGRGLGLSATLGIIRSYNGYLRLHSTVGKGTRFQIYWPATNLTQAATKTAVVSTVATKATILIIDDELDVRQAAGEILELQGYQIYEAADGMSGLDLFKTLADKIDLVLLDMHMPVMNGADTLLALRQIKPQIPVILSSGYTEHATIDSLQTQQIDFLQKPYDIDALLNKVQTVLASQSQV
ncbi:MAG: response regulator [Chloroflexota bacterium]